MSQMPAFGRDGILTPAQVQDVVSHVRVISGQEKPSASSPRGAQIFADNCASAMAPMARATARWARRVCPTTSGSMAVIAPR
jgi:mono/diheme cytochrome c family protein